MSRTVTSQEFVCTSLYHFLSVSYEGTCCIGSIFLTDSEIDRAYSRLFTGLAIAALVA
jgi:hypothetical protein